MLTKESLFYRPLGIGKTSLSFALASTFSLSIYIISLSDPTLTDEDLSTLFNKLPRHCILLIKDIDAAGLTRADDKKKAEAAPNDADNKVRQRKQNGITLSSLLNAINGVAS